MRRGALPTILSCSRPLVRAMTSTSAPAIACERPFERDRDMNSPNRNLAPVSTALDAKGRLQVGGCNLGELARR